jgi:hypothetical protein
MGAFSIDHHYPGAGLSAIDWEYRMTNVMRPRFTLPDLEQRLRELQDGALVEISRGDYERLFGFNDAALGRLRNFASGHQCVASFADTAILFRKRVASVDEKREPRL